jgi:hypothetical protein
MEDRTRRLRRLFSLQEPRRRDLAVVAVAVALIPVLLGVAAAQPVVVHRQSVTQRSDAEILIVFDTSTSMSARPAPQAPTRLQRAEQDAERILPQLGDIPVGLATMTDRVLPTLMPTTNDALIRRTIEQSIGINEPPPSQPYPYLATSLVAALPRLSSGHLFFYGSRPILVVFTDGEAKPLQPGIGFDLARSLTIPPLFVHVWAANEQVYHAGRVDPRYHADAQSSAVLQQFASLTRGAVFGEQNLGALVRRIRTEAGPAHATTSILGYSRIPLGQWFLLAGVFPLGFLFWRRNL